ncbi:hypothetical protein H5395_15465 [Paracoccus sp. MC1854]|uniref:hypothetical protein n=1 Tax=Paracoccus sp. MC1854 TaxID=2760306 RepID=UPI0016017223|nr:hypothetical protein [Paracoccus sp. MC1854]MBB1492894.1 hypothetical protein [Paracoccus sp. MC1854]
MTENITDEMLLNLMKAMHQRFDRLEQILREQGAAAAEERAHLGLLMQTSRPTRIPSPASACAPSASTCACEGKPCLTSSPLQNRNCSGPNITGC